MDYNRSSNLSGKLEPEMGNVSGTKTSIKIKDIDYSTQRAKLQIKTSKMNLGDSEGEESVISKDS